MPSGKIYYEIFNLEALKREHDKLCKREKELSGKTGATKSGGKNADKLSNIKKERKIIEEAYDEEKQIVLDWMMKKFSHPKNAKKLKCYLNYYSKVSYYSFQETINSLFKPTMKAINKDEGKINLYYKASNLFDALTTAAMHELE